jgi:hypothetical protein
VNFAGGAAALIFTVALQFTPAKLTFVFALVARLAEHFKPTAR